MVITHYCGLCGGYIDPVPTIHEGQVLLAIPPCKACIDDAMAQGEAKAIIDNVTKGKEDDTVHKEG